MDDYLKWICGFANARGGVLEIGRNDKGKVIGLKDPERLLEELPNKLRDLLGIVADIELLKENRKPYLRITVEPYPVPISYHGEYHYRSGSTRQVLKGAALDRFLLGKMGKRWMRFLFQVCRSRILITTRYIVFTNGLSTVSASESIYFVKAKRILSKNSV